MKRMSLTSRIGEGIGRIKRYGKGLALAGLMGAVPYNAHSQGYIFTPPIHKNIPISPGIVYDEDGQKRTAIGGPGFGYVAPRDKPKQEDNVQSQSSVGESERVSISRPFIWVDRNGDDEVFNKDGSLQVDEIDYNLVPEKGKWYSVAVLARNLAGKKIDFLIKRRNGDVIGKQDWRINNNIIFLSMKMRLGDEPLRTEVWCSEVWDKPAWREYTTR